MILSYPSLWRLAGQEVQLSVYGNEAVLVPQQGQLPPCFAVCVPGQPTDLTHRELSFPVSCFPFPENPFWRKKATTHKPTSGHTEVKCAFNYEIKVLKIVEQKCCGLKMLCCVVTVRTCIWTKMLWDDYLSCCVPPRLAAGEVFSYHQVVYRFPQLCFW